MQWRNYRSENPRGMHGPVGVRLDLVRTPSGDLAHCAECGYHVCSCVTAEEVCPRCDGLGDFGAPCGNGGAPCEECGGLGRVESKAPAGWRVAETATEAPELLTLEQAVEACRRGKTVRCVDDPVGRSHLCDWLFRPCADDGYEYRKPSSDIWQPSVLPGFMFEDRREALRFEVVK